MVKKSSLAKKLASYSAVATALIAGENANAQIVYTKLNPYDTVGAKYNSDYKLDLNNDGIYDFNFIEKSQPVYATSSKHELLGSQVSINCSAYSSNKLVDEQQKYARPLNFGDAISVNDTAWYNKGLLILKDYGNYLYQSWNGTGQYPHDHYAELKIIKGGKTYYGWVRIYVNNYVGYAIIKDYAYNSTPDSLIYAGEKCEGFNSFPTIQANDSVLTTDVSNKPIQWYLNNEPVPGDTTQTITVSKYGIYTVSEGDTNTTCSLTSLTSFNYINCNSYHPHILGAPVQYFCPNYAPELNIDTVKTDFSVQWYSDNVLLGDTSDYIFSEYIVPEPYFGNFYATVSEQGGCYDTTNTVDLIIDTVLSSLTIVQKGDTLIAESRYGYLFSPDINYLWFDSVGEVLADTNYYYVIPVNGEYTVAAGDSNLCGGQYRGYYYLTGINQVALSNILISDYNNLLTIKFNSQPYNGYKLVIYNYIGQQVYNSEITSGDTRINLSALAKGLYLVSLEKEGSRMVKKIVLE